ncbi:coiled-coil domain-containing protein [Sporolactobacillus kofuensis]|uniref:Coiled-coil domain-containing protein n=1 Tax=Sporolactobacillus kofuensis TaxID=269672 RepID=A0ABW1WDF8_9BACL|nr:C40 family peptidase [Sporolactobacillus kofuensis]MCO7174560.1 NlpC/P60 family protein [Sporolactobacillus kofuensis]
MKMNKKNATVTLALTFGLTYTSIAPSVTYASPSLSSINKQTAAKKSLQAQLSQRQQAIQDELTSMNKKQLQLTGEISDGQSKINKTNDQIDALKAEVKEIEARIEKRKALLNDRLVSIYKNGGSVNYLDVLLGSKNFGDFIDRTLALTTITNQDQKIITDQKNDQMAVNQKKTSVESKQAANVARLEKLKNTLSEVVALQEKKKIAAQALDSKQSNISDQLKALVSASNDLKRASIKQVAFTPDSSTSDNGGSSDQASSNQSSNDNGSSSSSDSNQSPDVNMSASISSGGISGILNYGNKFIGRSTYVFGASSPSTGQFDCSGFVHAAFAANGIGVGRSTGALVSQGSAVSFSSARPGDLVFFDTYKTNGHVGIYLGGGRFIGSQSSTGVAVVSMSNPYWKSHFRGVVRRILN